MFNILLTKKLSQEHLDLIKSWEWNYEIVETLSISPIEVKEIPSDADAWIVSSRNSFAVIKKSFDAIFVFSPRSSESLLKQSQFSSQTVFACIGSTTADYLRSRGIANVFVASYPDGSILLKEFHHEFANS